MPPVFRHCSAVGGKLDCVQSRNDGNEETELSIPFFILIHLFSYFSVSPFPMVKKWDNIRVFRGNGSGNGVETVGLLRFPKIWKKQKRVDSLDIGKGGEK